MKRIISLLLCLIMACGMLVGCGDEEIGSHLESLEQFREEPEKKLLLKLYIVYDEADEGALKEVERRINALTEADYNTQLDIVYLTADKYNDAVMSAAERQEQAIVLINSEDLVMDLYGDGSNVVITEYYEATAEAPVAKVVTEHTAGGSRVTKYNAKGEIITGTDKDADKIPTNRQVSVGCLEELSGYILPSASGDAKYGLLNAKIATSLIDASKLSYYVLDEEGKPVLVEKTYAHDGSAVTDANGDPVLIPESQTGLFTIPNNHLIDTDLAYTYLQINRQACEIWLNHDADYLRKIVDFAGIDALKAELREMLAACGQDPADADEYVKLVRGSYATKAAVEADEKYIMNVIAAPEATAEDAFSGAFAVLKGTDVDRAMRIIYAINMDADLHNLLQYGIKDTNYQLDENGNVTRFDLENKKYKMNILYTGNAFSAHYCEEENWTPEIAKFAESQNKVADLSYDEAVAASLEFLKAEAKAEKPVSVAVLLEADAELKELDAQKKEKAALAKLAAYEATGIKVLRDAYLLADSSAKLARKAADEAKVAAVEARKEAELPAMEFEVLSLQIEVATLERIAAQKAAIATELATEDAIAAATAAKNVFVAAKLKLAIATEVLENLKAADSAE
ncbi:MAG: hypothetical protein J6K14_03930 [Clostridia bacterium]|nr:hypothetical protein [Clostridia bacterium]